VVRVLELFHGFEPSEGAELDDLIHQDMRLGYPRRQEPNGRCNSLRTHGLQRVPFQHNLTIEGWPEPAHRPKERRLPCPVAADQRNGLSRANADRHVPENRLPANVPDRDVAEFEDSGDHITLLDLIDNQMRYGAPKSDSTVFNGTSDTLTERAMRSPTTTTVAPISMVRTTNVRSVRCVSRRARCGENSPANPTTPDAATSVAARITLITSSEILVLLTLTPRFCAKSSPTRYARRGRIRLMTPGTATISPAATTAMPVPDALLSPIQDQKIVLERMSGRVETRIEYRAFSM